ncbi:MAG: class I SAM-dependent methyltransferase [Eubacteriales bacterium]
MKKRNASQREPLKSEMFLTRIAFLLYGRSIYKDFAYRLPLSGNERVMDFGCGMGTVAYYTSQRLPDGRLTCVDNSKRWLSACRKLMRRRENVEFVQSEAQVSGFDNGTYDMVYCHFVLHNMPDDELIHAICIIAGCIKTGGYFVFREPLIETEKLNIVKRLADKNGLSLKNSRVIDIPLMGNSLESIYIKL